MSTINRPPARLAARFLRWSTLAVVTTVTAFWLLPGEHRPGASAPEPYWTLGSTSPKVASKGHEAKQRRAVERENYLFNLYRDPSLNALPDGIQLREMDAARLRPRFEDIAGKTSAVTYEWKEAGPTDVGGRSRAVLVDVANPNTLIAGGVSGGIWKSTNRGASWQLVSEHHLTITSIVQDTRAGSRSTWYASTGERRGSFADNGSDGASLYGTGLYKSTDNGSTWTRIQSGGSRSAFDTPYDFTGRLVVSPTTGTLFLADHDYGIYRSTDGGASFQTTHGTSGQHPWNDIAVDAQGRLLAVLSGNGSGATTAGVFRSVDDGQTWTRVAPGGGAFPSPYDGAFGRTVIAIAPSNPDVAYLYTFMDQKKPAAGAEIDDIRFFKVVLSSGTYDERSDNMPLFPGDGGAVNNGQLDTQQAYNQTLIVHPNDENHVFIGGTVLYRSRDGFATAIADKADGWIGGYAITDNNNQYLNNHPDHHTLFFDPSNPDRLYNGHDGGLSVADGVSANGPINWSKLNNGFNVTQFFTVSIAREAGDDRILGGTQDNGSPYFRWNGNTASASKDLSTGDGGWAYLGKNAVFSSSQNGNVQVENVPAGGTPDWQNSQAIPPCQQCGALFVNPAAMEPNEEKVLFYPAGADLHRANDGANWAKVDAMTLPTDFAYSALSVSTAPRGVLYVAGYSANEAPKVFRLDAAETSTDAPVERSPAGATAGSYILHIAINPTNADEIILSVSNYGVESLFHSTNGGQTYTVIEGNLSGIEDGPSVRAAAISVFNGETTYFAGTSTGLYATTTLAGAQTVWAQAGGSVMGMSPVAWIDSRISDGRIAVATHGRGIFVGTPSAGGTPNAAPSATAGTAQTNEDAAGAVTLAGTDPNGDNLTFAIASQPANGTVTLAGAVATYTPNANYNGSDSFTFTVSDGTLTSDAATVAVTVQAVNDAPSFTAGAAQSVEENSGAAAVAGWASAISAGPANEAGQSLTFLVTTDNAALFSAGPAVSADGTLSFTPAPNAAGAANVTVTLTDNGGTANDGADRSASATFTITVTPASGVANETGADLPTEFALSGNYPNPFNPTTSIVFDLPVTADVTVIVTDMLGRTALSMPSQSVSAGAARSLQVNASGLSSGNYLYRLEVRTAESMRILNGSFVVLK